MERLHKLYPEKFKPARLAIPKKTLFVARKLVKPKLQPKKKVVQMDNFKELLERISGLD